MPRVIAGLKYLGENENIVIGQPLSRLIFDFTDNVQSSLILTTMSRPILNVSDR